MEARQRKKCYADKRGMHDLARTKRETPAPTLPRFDLRSRCQSDDVGTGVSTHMSTAHIAGRRCRQLLTITGLAALHRGQGLDSSSLARPRSDKKDRAAAVLCQGFEAAREATPQAARPSRESPARWRRSRFEVVLREIIPAYGMK
ncbi:hypothetical protein HPB50_001850 [Hyalomma asiaticum]|uniref:Uncharacterized protein n=1 Tax=Hyalomma asiaticum TaxID=266040 RepID=A0ACB7S3Q1_HYAAI|nr:hypothetical protein HPB50_001850 [Hyalomma asiaticum]